MDEYRNNGNGNLRKNGLILGSQFVRAAELIPLALVEDVKELEKFGYALQRDKDGEIIVEDDAVRVAKSYKIRFHINEVGMWKPLSAQPRPAD